MHLRALLFYAAPLNDARKTISGNCFGVFISLKAPGLYSDGGNLGLQVMPGGGRSWIFQYDRAGKRLKLGLGPLHTISLEEAREKARELRAQLLRGEVPANARTAQRSSVSFRKVAAEFLAVHRDGWRSQQGAVNFERSLAQHIMPVLGDLAVDKIEVEDVFRVLSPIWHRKISTAALLRARIEQILDFARACRYRSGENPAVWKGNLAHRLPSKSKLHRPEPQPALPYQQLPEFMQHLRGVPGIPALALQFLILTATRTGDLIGGDRQNPRPLWAHVDVADALWVIPRGKNNQRHQVPLSAPVLRILEELKLARDPASDIVFTGDKPGTIMAIGAFALSLCRNGDQADDLVQDTLLKAWTNLASFEPGTNMLAWLCTILRNRFYSDCRSRRRALEPIDDFAEQIATRPTQMAQVEHEVLCVALAQLPARRREALISVGIAGFSYEETAKRCGCPEGTIKSRVNRARAELAELLAIEGCRSSSGAAGSIRRSSSRAAISEAFANFFVRAPRPRSLGACRVAMIDSHFAQMMSAALWSFFSSAFDTSRLMGCTLLHARHHARGNRSSKSMRFHAAAETKVFSRNPAGSR